jgi:hypothetical protein
VKDEELERCHVSKCLTFPKLLWISGQFATVISQLAIFLNSLCFLSPEIWGSDVSRKNERGHIKWLPILFLLTVICKCTLPATNNFYLANSDQK